MRSLQLSTDAGPHERSWVRAVNERAKQADITIGHAIKQLASERRGAKLRARMLFERNPRLSWGPRVLLVKEGF